MQRQIKQSEHGLVDLVRVDFHYQNLFRPIAAA